MPVICTSERVLPPDHDRATLIGRAWLPGAHGGATPVLVRDGHLIDLSRVAPTVSELLAMDDPLAAVRAVHDVPLATLAQALSAVGDATRVHLLAPCDLQPVKAAGVTFAASMLERVIEERARGDAGRAHEVRAQVVQIVGDDLSKVVPGSPQAMRLKEVLLAQGMWSQYLEVGIGPDAEIFTKAAPMSSVGIGSDVGLHPGSTWNNPEPEVVLAIDPRGRVVGAALGNDVNLRDFEGRSALLLGKAKDNNGACAIGPFIRLFDEHFGIDDVRDEDVTLQVKGEDGFELHGVSSMRRISRDPLDLAAQAMGPCHQYPDGVMLFCGTMFAPVQDRDAPGAGFTHKLGDIVTIGSKRMGHLTNRVDRSDRMAPWTYGLSALMGDLARRGLLGGTR